MTCPTCGCEPPAGSVFCNGCGAKLVVVCASCGATPPPGSRFCNGCGATLGASGARSEPKPSEAHRTGATAVASTDARKVVTIVFADLVGSTALHERLDPESARSFMESYYAAMRGAVESHGGTVTQLLGDGVKALFGVPRVAEDDAIRAVRAAVAMQDAFRALAEAQRGAVGKTGLRVAVNSGEVVANDETEIIGDPVNVAARLQEQGKDGDVVVGESTRRLVSTLVTLELLGSFTLKGRSEAVKAYRVVSLDRPAGVAATPFVGRAEEIARLKAVYDTAVAKPAAGLAVLVGSPGLGKSRLIDELARRSGESATVIRAHCDAAGGATFAPFAHALRDLLGIEDGASAELLRSTIESALPSETDRARIAGGIASLLAGSPASPEETFFVIRRMLAALARAKPVVLVIDDLHWAEPLLLDLVEHLIQWGSGVPLFVLIGARPELRDLRSSLVTRGGLVADVVTLAGLDAGAAMQLAANVIGASDLPAAIAAKVLATSEGNPLFVGELVRMLVQEGALTKHGDRWTADASLAAVEMPPTIHALLAARIERLRPDERTVLERASVVGRHFSRSAVAALLSRNGSELDARLEALRRTELIESDTGWFLGEPVLRFHHVLIRDAAYRRLLKGTRAELHERLADWIEGQVGDAEHDETIGWHLEQAHQHLRELGPLDAHGKTLGERAATRLAAAGRRALARDDVPLAAGLLGRAIERLDADASARADLALDWCEALLSAGDVGPAAAAIAELGRFTEGSERLRGWHTCFAGQLSVMTAPAELHAAADRVAGAARDLAALDDAAGEAKAHFVHAQALARLGKVGACEAALDQALAAARRAGDRRRANAVLAGAPLAALWGPSPVTRASGRCLDVVRVLRITQGAPAVEAVALSCQGVLEALRGRTEAARRMLASSRTMVEELGITQRLFEVDVSIGRVDLLEGDAAAAESKLRPAYEGLRDLGLGIDAARAAALLGRALLAQQRAAEAEQLSQESELLAGDDLQAAIAWRGVRAEALAARGEHAAAVELAEAAVAIAAATDALLDHADARVALAEALRVAGRSAEADAEARRAIELWDTKGATLLVERAGQAAPRTAPPVTSAEKTVSAPAIRGRVRPNLATATADRDTAAIEAGDSATLAALFNEAFEEIDHPTGSTYGRDAALASITRLMRSRDVSYRTEPLATLGPSLALGRRRIHASGTRGHRFDVGEYENETLSLHEVDAHGRHLRHEVFAADRLGEAIARLYQRYAEGLPRGPERERAAVVARAVAFMLRPGDAPDLTQLYAPTYEDVDHRSVGYGTLAREDSSKLLGSFREVADGIRLHVDDLLALDTNGFVRKTTTSGVWREGGGSFERTVCTLSVFGPDGRVTHHETFDPEREAEALARFDALTGASAPLRAPVAAPRARVRPNTVTRGSAKFEAICAARDFAALATFYAEDAECIDHPVGATYGADGMRKGIERLLQSPDARFRLIPLATLGESWGLVRREMSASGAVGRRFDVGAYEIVDVAINGTDERGRVRHFEIFAAERLRAAVARLYERYAESLPDGPARTRASGIARSLAIIDESLDADRIAPAYARSFECVDHRTLGTWSAHTKEQWLTHWREQGELAAGFAFRDDDVLALEPAALLLRETFFGSSRVSGGSFENIILGLYVFDADGCIAHNELFEPDDQEVAALARFDALTAGDAAKKLPERRVRPNRALATTLRFEAAFAAGDHAALASLFHEALTVVDHQNGATYGREGQLASLTKLLRARDPELRAEPLATLGEDLVLWRRRIRASGTAGGRFDVGEFQREEIVIFEVDAGGKVTRVEVFPDNRLRAAVARLYERYAESLPEGLARTRATGSARAAAAFDGPLDADRIANVHAQSFECVDHRILGTWSVHGRKDWRTHWRGQADLSIGLTFRDDDVLALEPSGIVARSTFLGTSRMGGGAFENVVITVVVFGGDGLIMRTEIFEPDQEAVALACFDALTARAAPKQFVRRVRPNTATATMAAIEAAFTRRNLAAIDALLADPMETIEHPTGTTYGRKGQLESSRRMMRHPDLTFRIEPLATLGDSLCLARRIVTASGTSGGRFDVGEYEIESIILNEVDGAGRLKSAEVFASDHLCRATGRLYQRYAELLPEGPERTRAAGSAFAHSVWDGPLDAERLVSVVAPSVVLVDHRSLRTWSLEGREEWLQHWRGQAELAAGFSRRDDDLLAFAPDVNVTRHTYYGTNRATGGPFENVFLALNVLGADGLCERAELFELEREADALARFDALIGGSAEPPAPASSESLWANAVTRFNERFVNAWVSHDWDTVAALHSPTGHCDDRRRLMQLKISAEDNRAQLRVFFEVPQSRWVITPLATRGERLALSRMLYEGSVAAGGGPLAIDYLCVDEVDAEGLSIAVVLFDADDLDAAYAELDACWRAGEGAEYGAAAPYFDDLAANLARRDWNAMTATLAPTFVAHDHRLVGFGTLHGAAAFLEPPRAMFALAPDARLRCDHVRVTTHGNIAACAWVGTREGGAFESSLLVVSELDASGRSMRLDIYDPHHLTGAWARFNEIQAIVPLPASAQSVPAIAKPIAAAATLDRWRTAFDAGFDRDDWEPMRRLCAPQMVFEDRRRLALLSGDRELMIASARERVRTGARPEAELVGTAGDHVAVSRTLWSGGPPDGRFEIEYLSVVEVDEAGLFSAIVFFDCDDACVAQREAWARWAAIEPAVAPWVDLAERLLDAFKARDREPARAIFADDVVVEDHRRTGFGRIEGAEAYFESVGVLWDLAPDQRVDLGWFWPAVEHHGVVTAARRFGTLADGGAFESDYLWLCIATGGRITRVEMFEVEDLDRAVARLAELRPDPLRIPPNAVTRGWDRWEAAFSARDQDALRTLYDSSYRSDDRRRFFRLTLDVGEALVNDRHLLQEGWRPVRTVLATAGDRLALQRVVWTRGEAGAISEVETLTVDEVDRQGRLVFSAYFDPDDRAAASAELFERWTESGDHGLPPAAFDGVRAWNAHDLDRLRALLSADFYLDDRRRTGVGRLDGADAYLTSVAAVWELSRDLRIETLYLLAVEPHGSLYVCRWFGTNAEGGEFDAVYVCIALARGGRGVGLEIYELDDLEVARARFEELSPSPIDGSSRCRP